MEDVERLLAFEDPRILGSEYWRYLDLQQWDHSRSEAAEVSKG